MVDGSRSPAKRKTGMRVRVMDRAAHIVISGGGLAVLAAMFGIMVFLVAVAVPLFSGARVEGIGPDGKLSEQVEPSTLRIINGTDRAILLTATGRYLDLNLDSGVVRTNVSMVDDVQVTAFAFEPGRWRTTLGTENGHIYSYLIDQRWHVVPDDAAVPAVAPGQALILRDPELRAQVRRTLGLTEDLPELSYLEADAEGKLTLWEPIIDATSDFRLKKGQGPIVRVDSNGIGVRKRFIVAIRSDRTAIFGQVRSTVRLDGGGTSERLRPYPFDLPQDRPIPDHVFTLADGSSVVLLWSDGTFGRLDTRNPGRGIEISEQGRLVESGRGITAAAMALGGATLIIGDDAGSITTFLMVSDASAQTGDGRVLRQVWTAQASQSPVLSLMPGDRDRTVVVSTVDDMVSMYHLTSHKRLFHRSMVQDLQLAVASPSSDLLLAMSDQGEYETLSIDPGYPGVSTASLFRKVHYEGYPEPAYVYQSTGDAQSEPKFSLVPLLFGTIKATVFAMLFALPLAVAAAVYTSEFMHRGVHRIIKPTIELMASLPSVVIGFVAAMFVAPMVRDWLSAIMVAMLVVPLSAAFVGTLWQMIPTRIAQRLGSRAQLGGALVLFGVAVTLGLLLGPTIERTMFMPSRDASLVEAGFHEPIPEGSVGPVASQYDTMTQAQRAALRAGGVFVVGGQAVKPVDTGQVLPPASGSIELWLDGNYGQAFAGWVVVMMFPAAVIVPLVIGRIIARRWNTMLNRWTRAHAAIAEVIRFVLVFGMIIGTALALAWALSVFGFDPRDSIFGRFTPRNTLVVGIVMGLAVIPIIYTISEDALSSVPGTLRSASLGTGATRWQTARRVVLPVAASGIFSAVMIGLGRAVGETMIVLMATGNTPEMDWNIFSGFRTLAANIAVELPEAPRGDAHYRVLFLCGLVLFVMTLVINTLAEIVRQHFRKKNAAL
jgi:phosphate transport system permease protein